MWTHTQHQHEVDEQLAKRQVHPTVMAVDADGIPAFFVVARPPCSPQALERMAAARQLRAALARYRKAVAA